MVENEKPEIAQPKSGRLISKFIEEISEVLKRKNTLFYRIDAKDIVEVLKIRHSKANEMSFIGFESVNPNRFITILEKYVIPGDWFHSKENGFEFKPKSIGAQLAKTTLESSKLRNELYPVNRIFTIPIPIMYNGCLTFPRKGYDARFGSWMNYDVPNIDEKMELEEAKKVIEEVFKEFCFQSEQDRINAIAGLLTPFLRGLYSSFNIRTPVFFYVGNRERTGKDYLAGITGIVYEGNALEEPPICNGEKGSNEELRKKILSAFIAGRKRMHFSNNKGYINNSVFEGIVTAKVFSDRVLGKNELLTFNNELEFSMSGNIGVSYTADLGNRCKFIKLFLAVEDANSRKFERPNLHEWVYANRDKVLSALFALVRNWFDTGRKKGNLPFTSFPEWAEICGGIMEVAGLGSPCVPDIEMMAGGDEETTEMKFLFELCYSRYPDEFIAVNQIKEIVEQEETFRYDFQTRAGQIMFGKKLQKYTGRILSNIQLVAKNTWEKGSNKQMKFQKLKQGNLMLPNET